MKINLRKARKLEQKIQSHIDSMSLSLVADVRVLGEPSEREEKVRSVRESLLAQAAVRKQLIQSRFEIRRQVGELNERLGLNLLMNRREEVQILLKLSLSNLEAGDLVQMHDLAESRRRQLEKGESGYGFGVSVKVSVATNEDVARFKTEDSELRRELEDIEDQLSQKNLGAEISLSSEVVALLRSQDLL